MILNLNIFTVDSRTTGAVDAVVQKANPVIQERVQNVVDKLSEGDQQEAWEELKKMLPTRLLRSFPDRTKTVKSISDALENIKIKGRRKSQAIKKWFRERLHEYYFGLDDFRKERAQFKDSYIAELKKQHEQDLKGVTDKKKIKEIKQKHKQQIKNIEQDADYQKAVAPLELNINQRLGVGSLTEGKQNIYAVIHGKLVGERDDEHLLDYGKRKAYEKKANENKGKRPEKLGFFERQGRKISMIGRGIGRWLASFPLREDEPDEVGLEGR